MGSHSPFSSSSPWRWQQGGRNAPTVLNAADEVAVEAFLQGRLPFLAIVDVVKEILDSIPPRPVDSLAVIASADHEAREKARSLLGARSP